MILSICTITYNHGPFLEQALSSFFRQEIDFDFEVIISDDASTDNTVEILKAWQQRYPEIIRLILHEKNQGVTRNFKTALDACTGKYVALCEGDDYWTDPKKLSKQVAILEAHPEISISFHRADLEFYKIEPFPFDDINASTKPISRFEDLVRGNFIHTPTCVYRNHLFGKYPEALLKYKFGDWPLHLLNAQYGGIHFLDETMAVYRIYSQGTWSARSMAYKVENTITFLHEVWQYFDRKYESLFRASKRNYIRYLVKILLRSGDYSALLKKMPSLIRSYFEKH